MPGAVSGDTSTPVLNGSAGGGGAPAAPRDFIPKAISVNSCNRPPTLPPICADSLTPAKVSVSGS